MNKLEKCRKRQHFDEVKHTVRKIEGFFEVILLTGVYYLVWKLSYNIPSMHNYNGRGKWLLMGVYAFITYVLFLQCDCFKFGHLKYADISISQAISLIMVNTFTYMQLCLIANHMLNVVPILILYSIDIIISLLLSYIFTVIYHHFCVPKRMVMIYGTQNAISLKTKMDTRDDKYKIVKMIPCNEFTYKEIINEIVKYDAVVINDVTTKIRNDLMKYCYQNSIRAYLVPKLSDIIYSGGEDITLFDTPLILVKGNGLTPAQKLIKRIFDIVFCLCAMIFVLPITVVTAIAIKIDDGGTVFYKQKRVTKDGRVFEILKFRSMIKDAESDGQPHPATDNDVRITRVGRVIRAMRIDELPQVFNILKGDMSVVGPRPERIEHYEKYNTIIPEFRFRNKVKGGLTGFAQIYGKYNTSALDKLRLDMMYIENYSLMLDIKLVLMTCRIMFKKESTEGFVEQSNANCIEKN